MRIPQLRLLLCMFFGGSALLFLLSAGPAQAAEDPCAHSFNCIIPTPTMVQPHEEHVYASPRAVLFTGLSWNDTKVEVYIDGQHDGRATLRTDPSQVGNFFYRPQTPLKPGKHSMYVIALSLSEEDRSPKSSDISFIVQQPKPATALPIANPSVPAQTPTSTSNSLVPGENPSSANSVLDWFFNNNASSTASSTPSFFQRPFGKALLIFGFIVIVLLAVLYLFKPKYEESPHDTTEQSERPPDQKIDN